MITITKLNNVEIVINPDFIECIEATPDTTISMTTGRKFIARESVDIIVQRIIDYKKKISN